MFKQYSLFIVAAMLSMSLLAAGPEQPLPSWHDGQSKQAIINFVKSVTDSNSPDYLPEDSRIAVYDNDGTLWAEKPVYFQMLFAVDQLKSMESKHPQWKENATYQAMISGDLAALSKASHDELLKFMIIAHSGMSNQTFSENVKEWLKSATHPETGRLYTDMVYQPMLELLDYMKANGFKNYIVSGGGVEFMRVWTEAVYGIPPEQVIGSTIKMQYEIHDGKPQMKRLPEIANINDKEGKPINIVNIIGRRPVAAFGNSDGDWQMLQWTSAGEGKRLGVIIHHTDDEREWAYDKDSHVGKLDKALEDAKLKGWTVIDMKQDWKHIYKHNQ